MDNSFNTPDTSDSSNTCDAVDANLLGAAAFLDAYQQIEPQTLQSRLIDLNAPSIIFDVKQVLPALAAIDDTAIFNPMAKDNYETQCHDNLYHHLRYLQLEFIGESELTFYHTLLIILIRRGYQLTRTFALFEQLWHEHCDYLIEHLPLRWLVSACDTLVDFSDSAVRRAILMNVTSIINTVKLYETKLFLLTDNTQPLPHNVDALYAKHTNWQDGLTFFRLGTDDTLEQMRRRFLRFDEDDDFATTLLLAVFYRLHDIPSAFALIKQFHTEDWGYQWGYTFNE